MLEAICVKQTAEAINGKAKKRARRGYTQRELAEILNCTIVRQPRDEVIVFETFEYHGIVPIFFNSRRGLYDTHALRVKALVRSSVRLPEPEMLVLDLTTSRWKRLTEKLGLNGFSPGDLEPRIYTLEADEKGNLLSLEVGDTLEDYEE